MLDLQYIREHRDEVGANNKRRGVTVDLDALLELDDRRRGIIHEAETLRASRNQASKSKPTEEEIARMREVGGQISVLEQALNQVERELAEIASKIPNLTHPDVPSGGEDDFITVATVGEAPRFDFEPKDHEQLLTDLGLIDFERGAKVAGAKFYFAQGDLVRLNQALLTYALDVAHRHGYSLLETPDLAKNEILAGTGYNPRGPETQIYSIENTGLSLIATAEIPVGGYHAGEIVDLSAGPKRYAAISHCFRTEAGAYGRTSKGLYRVHQFAKVEFFVICEPRDSESLHQEIVSIEREIIDGLGLAYRVIDTAAGDLGGPAYRKYDIEAWMVMKDGYGEVTSASNCTDYQARRLNIRYRAADGQTAFVHTLNGTAVNTSRWPLAIAEQYQTAEGTIRVPEVLQPYLGGQKVLCAR